MQHQIVAFDPASRRGQVVHRAGAAVDRNHLVAGQAVEVMVMRGLTRQGFGVGMAVRRAPRGYRPSARQRPPPGDDRRRETRREKNPSP